MTTSAINSGTTTDDSWTDTKFGQEPASTWGVSQNSVEGAPLSAYLPGYEHSIANWTVGATQYPLKITSSSQVTSPEQSEASSTVAFRTPPSGPNQHVVGLRKWVGVIQDIEDGVLTIELEPLDHEGPTLLGDFDLDLLAPDDAAAVPGDVVYLTTRMVRGRWGHKEVTSHLRLRRAGQWSREELRELHDQALDRSRSFERYVDGCA
jgi:hypothetical protein